MRTSTFVRITVGLLFMAAGFIKTKRLGKKVVPEAYKAVEKGFKKMNNALKDFPGRDSVKIGPAEAQEIFGYIDLICGFLLLTGNMVGLACFTLIIEVAGLEYTLFIMGTPFQYQAIAVGLIVALFTICGSGSGKEKTD